jgi:hypothetical protein
VKARANRDRLARERDWPVGERDVAAMRNPRLCCR